MRYRNLVTKDWLLGLQRHVTFTLKALRVFLTRLNYGHWVIELHLGSRQYFIPGNIDAEKSADQWQK